MIAEAEEDHLVAGKLSGLIDRVAIPFLVALDGELHAQLKLAHLLGLGAQGGIFLQPLEIRVIRPGEVIADGFLVAGLDDDADLLDPGVDELDQVIMNQGPGDSIRPDDGLDFQRHAGVARFEIGRR